jgi:uncharacterized membrane protein YvlD (DUF360 family)
MAKIDEIKEILNSLRVAMSIAFGIFVLVVGKIVSLYSANVIDEIFWAGIVISVVILFIIYFIVKKIAQKTREIRDIK